jgi:predicted ATPase
MAAGKPQQHGRKAGARGLVGRREQLAVVEEAVRRAEAGDPQFVVVGGEAGVGKTHFMGYVADRLQETGARVLRTTCVELGGYGLPLVPVTAALRQIVEHVGTDTLRRTMPGGEALLALLPEHSAGTLEPDRLTRMSDLFAALLQRFGTDHPAVLVVDDLHRADRSSRELLGFLAHILRACRVLVLTAYRADELAQDHPLRPFLAELGRIPSVGRVELARFNRAETAELIAGVLGRRPSAALIQRIYHRSGGNAFFALELARAGDPAVLPESLRDLLLQRITDLPDQTRRLVQVAAIGDRSIPHRLLATVSTLADTELLAGIRRAVDVRILVPDGDGYAFRHPLVREAVLDGLLPVERARLHRAMAEALEADPGLVPPIGMPPRPPSTGRRRAMRPGRCRRCCAPPTRPAGSPRTPSGRSCWAGRCGCGRRCPTTSGRPDMIRASCSSPRSPRPAGPATTRWPSTSSTGRWRRSTRPATRSGWRCCWRIAAWPCTAWAGTAR